MNQKQNIMKTLEKSRVQTIASEIGCYVYFNLFDDDMKRDYHNNGIDLHTVIEENINDVIESLRGSDLIRMSELEHLKENEESILDDIITESAEYLEGEIEADELEDFE